MKYAVVILFIFLFLYLGNRLIAEAAKSRKSLMNHSISEEPETKNVIRMAYEERKPSSQVAEEIFRKAEQNNRITMFSYAATASEVRQMLFDEQADVIIINGEKPKWLKEVVCRRIKTEHGMKNVTILWRKYRGREKRKMKALIEIINEGNLYEQKES